MHLLPASWMPYAKSWVALLGVVLVTLSSSWDGAPGWLTPAAAVVTAIGVYLTPNADKPADEHDDTLRV